MTDDPVYRRAEREARGALVNLIHLIYQDRPCEGHYRDYEFSADSMHEHWKNGYEDTVASLKRKDWLKMPPKNVGVVTHDVHRDYER